MRLVVATCLLAIAGCGGDPRAEEPVDAAGEPACAATCDLVAQTGCAAGEKCAYILDDAFTQSKHVGCAPNGDVLADERCIGPTSIGGADECVAGTSCHNNQCLALCAGTDSCAGGVEQCADFEGDPCDGAGVCFVCDPLGRDCPPDDACYQIASGRHCAAVFAHGKPGDACAVVNECTWGSVCRGDPGRCMRYCSLALCPPELDDNGDWVAWSSDCAGGEPYSGRECEPGESCVGIEGGPGIGVCEAL